MGTPIRSGRPAGRVGRFSFHTDQLHLTTALEAWQVLRCYRDGEGVPWAWCVAGRVKLSRAAGREAFDPGLGDEEVAVLGLLSAAADLMAQGRRGAGLHNDVAAVLGAYGHD